MGDQPAADAPLATARALAPALHDLAWLLRREGCAEAGLAPLPPSEVEVIRLVVARPGIRVTAVAQELAMQHSNVSAAVRHLVELGLLSREPDPTDRRAVCLTPTELAVDNTRRLLEAWTTVFAAALRDLPPDRAEVLAAAVPALCELKAALRARQA